MQARNRGCMQARKHPSFNLRYMELGFIQGCICGVVGRVGLSNGDQEVLGSISAFHHVICL